MTPEIFVCFLGLFVQGAGVQRQLPKIGLSKTEIQFFFFIKNKSMSVSFGKKVSDSVGDYKNAKTLTMHVFDVKKN